MITAKKLCRKTNLDEVIKSGLYYYPVNSKMRETPCGKESAWGLLLVVEEEDGQFQQILISFGNLYYRQRLEIGGWSPWTNLSTGVEAYVLNNASDSEIGGIKVGSGLSINQEGELSAPTYKLPTASKEVLGGIKVGENLTIDSWGTLSANQQVYCLPYATETRLGGIKLGSGLYMDEDGCVHVQFPDQGSPQIIKQVEEHQEIIENPYFLPIASTTTLGGIKIGENLEISEDGVLSAKNGNTFELEVASDSKIGGIRLDGIVFSTNEEGYLTINRDEILPPKMKKEFTYQLEDENYLFSFSIEDQLNFLNKVIIATMSQAGILGGYDKDFNLDAIKEDTNEEVVLSLSPTNLLDLYINGYNKN